MTFTELCNEELTRRLGTDDLVDLFTTVRRQAAINAAQEWFIQETGCLWRTADIPLQDGLSEYDLEVEIEDESFMGLATSPPDIKIVPATGATRYIAGPDDFPRRTIDWLDQESPGWREADAATPCAWYDRPEGAQLFLGLTPAPAITTGDVWTLRVRYVVQADTMTADADEPFTLDNTTKVSLRPYHPTLADYATYQLEQLRKGLERSATFLALARSGVADYADKQRTPGGGVIQTQRPYWRQRDGDECFGSRFGRCL